MPARFGRKLDFKEHTPAGVLFSGAMMSAGRTHLPVSPKGSQMGFMEEELKAGEAEPFIRLGGLEDHVEGILRCRRIVFIACGARWGWG